MSTEIELKLQLDPHDAEKLSSHPLLSGLPHKAQALLNTYFDSPALTLHDKKVALRLRKKGEQWLCTVKTAEPATGGLARRSEWEVPATPGSFDFSHVDAPALRDMLESMRASFVPIFTTDFVRKSWELPFGESTIEFAIDQGFVESQGRKAAISEIELELIAGQIEDLFALSQQLQADFDLRPALASKAERGYALFLDAPPQPCQALRPSVVTDVPPREAFRELALACLEIFQRNAEGIRKGDETAFIAPAINALNWLQEDLAKFRSALPEAFFSNYAEQWAHVARTLATGQADTIERAMQGRGLSQLILAFTADLYALEEPAGSRTA